jgi:hypothetical protein
MTHKLILKQYGGPEIAAITQAVDGKLLVETLVDGLQAEIEDLVQRVSRQGPLTLIGGYEENKGRGPIHITTSRMVAPGDPNYLRALADALSKQSGMIQNKRVRAYVVES